MADEQNKAGQLNYSAEKINELLKEVEESGDISGRLTSTESENTKHSERLKSIENTIGIGSDASEDSLNGRLDEVEGKTTTLREELGEKPTLPEDYPEDYPETVYGMIGVGAAGIAQNAKDIDTIEKTLSTKRNNIKLDKNHNHYSYYIFGAEPTTKSERIPGYFNNYDFQALVDQAHQVANVKNIPVRGDDFELYSETTGTHGDLELVNVGYLNDRLANKAFDDVKKINIGNSMSISEQGNAVMINLYKTLGMFGGEYNFLSIKPAYSDEENYRDAIVSINGTLTVNSRPVCNRSQININGTIYEDFADQILNKQIETLSPDYLEFEIVGAEVYGVTNKVVFRFISSIGSKYYYEGMTGDGVTSTGVITKFLASATFQGKILIIDSLRSKTEQW